MAGHAKGYPFSSPAIFLAKTRSFPPSPHEGFGFVGNILHLLINVIILILYCISICCQVSQRGAGVRGAKSTWTEGGNWKKLF